MKRSLLALLLLAPVLPPSVSHADGPTTIAEFLAPAQSTRIIAHRGFSGAAPENTRAAMRAAIAIGAPMVEVDVTLSADGQLVVIHDEDVERTTDGRGAVADLTLAQLQGLDAGSWFAPEFAGEPIPTLDGVLEEVAGRTLLNVEIKPEAVERGIVAKVVEAIRAHGLTDQVIVSSFSPSALMAMRTAAPEIATAVLFNPELQKGRDPVEIVAELGASVFNIKRSRLSERKLERCLSAGVPVAVYTVNSPRTLRKLMQRRVHAVFTDHPDRMLEVVRTSDAHLQPGVAASHGGRERLAPRHGQMGTMRRLHE